MTSRRAFHRGSSSGIDARMAEDISGLDRKSLEEMMMTLPDVVWVLKIVGSNSHGDSVKQFFGGVCIGSEGLILTNSKGMTSEVQGVTLDDTSVFGRPRNNPSFKKLELFWEDSESVLKIFRVEDNTERESYHHTCVSDVGSVDSDLIGIGVNGDQPFSRFICYAPGPVAKFNGTKYLTVYGKCFAVASIICDDCIVATTMAGSPIFNGESGKLVGIIDHGVDEYCLAIPLDKRVIKQLKKLK